jgi:hypothetical protein
MLSDPLLVYLKLHGPEFGSWSLLHFRSITRNASFAVLFKAKLGPKKAAQQGAA